MKPLKSFYIYAVAFLIAGAAPFLLLPFLTRSLSPEQFGVIASFYIWVPLISAICGMSSHGYVAVRFFKESSEDFQNLSGSLLWSTGAAHLIVLIIVDVFFLEYATKLTNLSSHQILACFFASMILSWNLQMVSTLQVMQKPVKYLAVKIAQAVPELALCLFFLYLISYQEAGARIYSYILALATSFAVGLYFAKEQSFLSFHLSFKTLKKLLGFFVPIVPHIISGALLSSIDRIEVNRALGADSLGVYAAAVQIGMILMIAIEPINKVMSPWLFLKLRTGTSLEKKRVVVVTYKLYCLMIVLGFVVATIAYYGFDTILDSRYSHARPLIPWIIGGFVMQGFYYMQVNYLFFTERTGLLSCATVTTLACGYLLTRFMVDYSGLQGAAQAFFVSNVILFSLTWLASSKVVKMPWLLGK